MIYLWLDERVTRDPLAGVQVDGIGAQLAPQGLLESEGLVVSYSAVDHQRDGGEGRALKLVERRAELTPGQEQGGQRGGGKRSHHVLDSRTETRRQETSGSPIRAARP